MASGEDLVRLIREDLSPVEIQLEQFTPRAVANLFNVNVNGTARACMSIFCYYFIRFIIIIYLFFCKQVSTRCF